MIILDTNIISALIQQEPDPVVISWLDNQPAEAIWISNITQFEARYGIALLSKGQRKVDLQERFDQLLQEDLENRVLLFDANVADHAAELAAQRKAKHAGDLLTCATPLSQGSREQYDYTEWRRHGFPDYSLEEVARKANQELPKSYWTR